MLRLCYNKYSYTYRIITTISSQSNNLGHTPYYYILLSVFSTYPLIIHRYPTPFVPADKDTWSNAVPFHLALRNIIIYYDDTIKQRFTTITYFRKSDIVHKTGIDFPTKKKRTWVRLIFVIQRS